jgi:hypothetical protein
MHVAKPAPEAYTPAPADQDWFDGQDYSKDDTTYKKDDSAYKTTDEDDSTYKKDDSTTDSYKEESKSPKGPTVKKIIKRKKVCLAAAASAAAFATALASRWLVWVAGHDDPVDPAACVFGRLDSEKKHVA